jgi:hypothetical protein
MHRQPETGDLFLQDLLGARDGSSKVVVQSDDHHANGRHLSG